MKYLFRNVVCDLRSDPFFVGNFPIVKVVACSIGFRAALNYRFSNYFYRNRRFVIAYFLQRRNLRNHGLDISPSANIGPGLRLLHTPGVVIGAGVNIGRNCTILQGVTIGVKNVLRPAYEDDYPTIGSNVTLACNSIVLGKVQIADNQFIRMNSEIVDKN